MLMRRVFGIMTTLVLCMGFALPAGAEISVATAASSQAATHAVEEERPDTLWKITMSGRIMTNRGHTIIFLLNHPENMQITKKDKAQGLIWLPIDGDTAFVDANGNPAGPGEFLANQQARVTFRYYWQEGAPSNTARIVDCTQVAIQGEAQKVHSYASLESFGEEVLVGTVVSNKSGKLEVYVEHGRVTVLNGDGSSTEYTTYGPYTIETKNLPVYGTDGKRFDPKLLEQGVRVTLFPKSAMWQESYPPSYVAESFQKIRAMGPGEKMLAPEDLRSTERVSGTVRQLKKETDEYGNNYYVLTFAPREGSRLRKRQAEYSVRMWEDPATPVFGVDGKQSTYTALKPGVNLEIRYAGIRFEEASRSIDDCSQIHILP